MNQTLANIGLLLVRIFTGVIFIVHGAQKFQGLDGTSSFFQSLGLPGWMAPVVATVELVGGIALVLGIGTLLAGAALTIVMIGVLLTAKKGQPFGSIEFDLLILFTSLQQALVGGRFLAVDQLFGRKKAENSNVQV
ncbi:DoxX family protein [Paenibacillus polymyxa]|uniref:DoxX family protein n=1 Tax=Paenibacillus polymyxa TaxID=1406 RepID=UPI000D317497|nr:DoxX family protein [Paenibacillus polymyxa]KAE8562087.1 oxidoreductase [Paenibacillus polymyxa]MCJ1220046.1 DoxX family protein [Paenibacillus polymyxa]MDU8673459.1 DoxX family protein [Paenibacillus polymyxa]MDU8698365.1 DoxX family protein [Paenibacillus polymyxa]PTU47579.1 oxidoreductase [Paenibacillus polymyxa]